MSESEIFNALQAKIANNLNVALPAVVEDYNFKEQRASVKITMKQLYGGDLDIDYPILSGVPVIFPRSGGASITMPVQRGDHCLLVFLDRDSRAWLLGGVNVKPQSKRAHHLSDGVAIMGLSPFSKESLAENNRDMLINFEGSKIRLKPKGIVDIETAKEVNVQTEGVIIKCKNAVIKAEESIEVQCKNAKIKANEISTDTPSFIQKGNMKIEGNIEVTGTSLLTGKVTSRGGIENSGANLVSNGKTFETHNHTYQDVGAVVAPSSGGPCTVTKTPTSSQAPS